MLRRSRPAPARRSDSARRRDARRIAAFVLLGVLAGGCGKEDDVTQVPDCGGSNLIAFASDRNGRSQIFLYDTPSGEYRLLQGLDNGASADRNPSITRDARYIAFERSGGSSGVDVLVFDRCAGAIAPVSGLNTVGDETDPAFTGDGLKLAFARDTLGHRRLRLFDGQNDRYVPLPGIDAPAGFDDWAPSSNQSGSKIAFVSNRNGNDDVFVYDAAGDSLLALPDLVSPEQDTDPWLTPDGNWLAFASSRAGGSGLLDIRLYDLQTKTFITLDTAVNSAQDDRGPTLSPDANVVLFVSNRSVTLGGFDLFIHLRSGTGVERPSGASSAGSDESPALVWP